MDGCSCVDSRVPILSVQNCSENYSLRKMLVHIDIKDAVGSFYVSTEQFRICREAIHWV